MEFKNMFINMIEPSDVKLLRCRYNINGTHAGFIYYTTNTFDYVDDAENIAGAISLRVGDNTHLEVYGPSEIIASDKPVNDKLAIRTTLNNVGGDKDIGMEKQEKQMIGDEPFIYPGNLDVNELATWLYIVAGEVRSSQRLPGDIKRIADELAARTKHQKDTVEFLSKALPQQYLQAIHSQCSSSDESELSDLEVELPASEVQTNVTWNNDGVRVKYKGCAYILSEGPEVTLNPNPE